jgi:hypothetical protein
MKTASIFAVLGIVALAACEMEAPPPQAGPGWGGPGWGGPGWAGPPPGWSGPPPAGHVDVARAERACVAQADRQGLRVRRVGQTDILTGSRGRVIGTQTILRVSRGGRTYPVRCNYTFDSRVARITPIRRG